MYSFASGAATCREIMKGIVNNNNHNNNNSNNNKQLLFLTVALHHMSILDTLEDC